MKIQALILTSAAFATALAAQQSNIVILKRTATVTETSQFQAGTAGQKNATTKTPIETVEIVDVNRNTSQEIEIFRGAKQFLVGEKRDTTGFTIMPIRPTGFLWYRASRIRGQAETPSLAAVGDFDLGLDFEPATPDGAPDYFSTFDTAITEVGTGGPVKLSSTLTIPNAPSRIVYSGDSAEMFNDIGAVPNEAGIKSIVLSGTTVLDTKLMVDANAPGGQQATSVTVTTVGSLYGSGKVATFTGLALASLTRYPVSADNTIVTTTPLPSGATGLTLQLFTNSAGTATAALIDNPGTGYKIGDVVTIPAGQYTDVVSGNPGASGGATFTVQGTAVDTFPDVPLLTTGVGTGALATVVVVNEKVESVAITTPGSGYEVGDTVTIAPASIGSLGGSGFTGTVEEVVDLTDRALELVKTSLTNTQGLTEIVP